MLFEKFTKHVTEIVFFLQFAISHKSLIYASTEFKPTLINFLLALIKILAVKPIKARTVFIIIL